MIHKDVSLTTAYQTLPAPLFLHNTTGSNVTLTFKPPGNLSAFKNNQNVLPNFIELPTLQKAKTATAYDTTSSGLGTGAKLTVTVSDVGDAIDPSFPNATGAVFGGTFVAEQAYQEPTSSGAGTGLKCYIRRSGSALNQTVSVIFIEYGSGYSAGQTLTFTNSNATTYTYTLTAADITSVFKPSAAVVPTGNVGLNYAVGDELYATLTETVSSVNYEYPVKVRIKQADLTDIDSVFVLAPTETTPFAVQTVKAGGSVTIAGFTE